mmetsp:Transcript_6349/g.17860  ORF Transcript_6349/g.17860 Transcript_6349/m.17860 type:complete len:239 (+) Transcript_6349:909-1625(+)
MMARSASSIFSISTFLALSFSWQSATRAATSALSVCALANLLASALSRFSNSLSSCSSRKSRIRRSSADLRSASSRKRSMRSSSSALSNEAIERERRSRNPRRSNSSLARARARSAATSGESRTALCACRDGAPAAGASKCDDEVVSLAPGEAELPPPKPPKLPLAPFAEATACAAKSASVTRERSSGSSSGARVEGGGALRGSMPSSASIVLRRSCSALMASIMRRLRLRSARNRSL